MEQQVNREALYGERRGLGENLKRLRIIQGLQQKQVACKVGITDRTLRKIENGNYNTTLSTVVAIAKTLGYTIQFNLKRILLVKIED